MSLSSVELVEKELNVTLPPACVQYLSPFPFAADSFVVWSGLTFDPSGITLSTQQHRANGFFDRSWPAAYLVLGTDGLGNDFFIDLTNEASPVFLADHEASSGATKLEYEIADASLESWIAAMQHTEEATPEWMREQMLDE
jgi:hypothetical protein